MTENLPSLFEIGLVFALVFLNAFFVTVEFALVRSHPTKFREKELLEKYGSKSSLALLQDIDVTLSATQLGITIASLVLGWWGEQTFQKLFYGGFLLLGEPVARYTSHAVATALAFFLVTFLHVVIGELAAKSLGLRYPETLLRVLAGPTVLFTAVCRPAIWVLNKSANLLLRIFGIKGATEMERVHSIAELAMLVTHSTEQGYIDKDEEQMLKGVFGFSDTVAREVMTPRTDLVTIHVDSTFDEVLSTIVTSGLSRFPVVGDRTDDIKGIILARDLLPVIPRFVTSQGKNFSVINYMREPYVIPGTKPIDDLLNEFKSRKLHLAIVVDEHGGVDGVVTLEDLVEEIVGDIFDEKDIPEKDVVVEPNGDLLVDGGVLVSEIKDRFNVDIPEGDYDTIAGFIFTSLGRMPEPGDKIGIDSRGELLLDGDEQTNGITSAGSDEATENDENGAEDPEKPHLQTLMTVEKISSNRIETVRLSQLAKPEISESPAEPAPS